MRVACLVITLSVLIGCAEPFDVPYGVTMSNSRAVVITLSRRTQNYDCPPCTGSYPVFSIMVARAQQECDYYGKDAVLNREEVAYSYTRYHYRCETRKADQVIDVQ